MENKPPLFGLQDGSLTKNLLTWRNEGEIDSWTADTEGPTPIGENTRGVYANCSVSGGSGIGAIVSIEYESKNLANPIVNNPGSGYKNGETITIDLDGTNTITGTITVTTEGVEEGWFASDGAHYFVSANVDGEYYGSPTFKYGAEFGTGSNMTEDYTEEQIQDSVLRFKPSGPRLSTTLINTCPSGHWEFKNYVPSTTGDRGFRFEHYGMYVDGSGSPTYTNATSRLALSTRAQSATGKNDGIGKFTVSTRDENGDLRVNIQADNGNILLQNHPKNGDVHNLNLTNSGTLVSTAVLNTTSTTETNFVRCEVNSNGTLQRVTSSRRYKNNIRDLDLTNAQALNIVDALQPRLWEDHQSGETVLGLVAEEVYDVAGEHFVSFTSWSRQGEVVIEDQDGVTTTSAETIYPNVGNGQTPVTRDGGTLTDNSEVVDGLNNKALIVALLKAVQELKSINADIISRIEALEGA